MLETILSLLLSKSLFVSSLHNDLSNKISESEATAITQNINILNDRPLISAESGLVFDINSNTILFEKNSHKQLPIASLTKLMTAYILLSENSQDEVVNINSQATSVEPSKIWLLANDQFTVESLLSALIIESANDAAYALAIHNAGSLEAFTKKMNRYAQAIGLKNTHYNNPAGFDDPNNYSTSYDLLILSKLLLKYPIATKISNQQNTVITNVSGNRKFTLQNTNLLLKTVYEVIGLKTGTTPIAGQCLITVTNSTSPKITIVIGSYNRFQDTKVLLDWALNLSPQI